MPAFIYKCPSCGNSLRYDPRQGKFACEFCQSSYVQEDLPPPVEVQDAEQMVYSCPSCGAELVTDLTTAATMCYYCHSPVVLTGRLSEGLRPDSLVPFQYDRRGAKEKFFAWIRKKKYVPRDFVSEAGVRNLSGVYYPYWLADFETQASFSGEGRIVTQANTPTHYVTTTKFFKVTREGTIAFRDVQRGALTKADRKLSDRLHPYRTGELKDFEPSYLSGFLAEKRDVEKEEVSGPMEAELQGYVQPLLTAGSPYTSLTGAGSLRVADSRFRYVLLPAWIMTYGAAGAKPSFFAMNGQTGEVCGRLPVNMKKLLLHCGLLALMAGGLSLAALYLFL